MPSGVHSYTYDTFGNLKTVTLPNADVITYVLDGLNRRTGVKLNGTLQKQYVWQDQFKIVAELDGSNNVTAEFIYGTGINVPDYMKKGGSVYKIMTNHLGSVVAVVNTTTGAVAQQIVYDEFGNITGDTNSGFQPFGFAGGLYDNDTKLVHFNAREYDAETGRWMSKDPIGFNGGDTNLYGYVLQDPVNFVDPNGKIGIPLVITIGAGLGAIWFQEQIEDFFCTFSLSCQDEKRIKEVNDEVNKGITPQCFPDEKKPHNPNWRWSFETGKS